MEKKKQYSVNEKQWPEAKNWGWGISSVEGFKPEGEAYPKLVKEFVKKRCPIICEVFYNSIQDGLMGAGMDEGHAIELTEEILAGELDNLLINLAHEISPELLETK